MARYGEFKYGAEKYGAVAKDSLLSWGIEVDWNDDGHFDGANEVDQCIALDLGRGRDNYLGWLDGNIITNFEPVTPGRVYLTLINDDGRYDPYNTNSPLYPNISPGKLAKIKVRDNSVSNTQYDVFAGRILDIIPVSTPGNNVVKVTLIDGLNELNQDTPSLAIQTSIDIDTAVGTLIDDSGYYWGKNVGDSSITLTYWYAGEESYATALDRLAQADLGVFFIAENGAATFVGRNTTVPISIDITQADLLKEIAQGQPWETLRDKVTVNVYPKVLRATGDIWTLQDKPAIAAGATSIYWASFAYNYNSVPCQSIISPLATTDYTMNAQADGLGADMTGDFTVTIVAFSKTAKVTITNNSASTGYITLLKIRGDALDTPDLTAIKAGTGKREFLLDNEWIQLITTAEAYAEYLQDSLSAIQHFPVIQFEDRPELQFGVGLFGALSATIDKLGLSSNYSVSNIKHEWLGPNGQSVRTTMKLEPFIGFDGGWQFPVQLGVDSIFAL